VGARDRMMGMRKVPRTAQTLPWNDFMGRANWQLFGDGEGIHWPTADEDLSVAGLLAGSRSADTRAG